MPEDSRSGAPPAASAVNDSSALYSRYGGKIYNLAVRMTGDPAMAEDIVQETFVKVFKSRKTFRGESAIYTWIYAIAKNVCLRHRARMKRSSFRSFEDLIETAGDSNTGETFDEAEKRFYLEQVKDGCLLGLLRCLPFHQRLAFILNILFGLPAKTVSEILGKSENSARILISRARRGLKNFLCANCSLYRGENACRCENLVRFSREKAWIAKYEPGLCPAAVESELREFRSELALYGTLRERDYSPTPGEALSEIIARKNFAILSRKKVK
jgi:RNA polymerase sigma factor (sigma-70 family)